MAIFNYRKVGVKRHIVHCNRFSSSHSDCKGNFSRKTNPCQCWQVSWKGCLLLIQTTKKDYILIFWRLLLYLLCWGFNFIISFIVIPEWSRLIISLISFMVVGMGLLSVFLICTHLYITIPSHDWTPNSYHIAARTCATPYSRIRLSTA